MTAGPSGIRKSLTGVCRLSSLNLFNIQDMAKKSVAAPSAVAVEAAAKKNRKPMLRAYTKIEYFWEVAELAWKYCKDNRARLALAAPYLTEQYVDDQIALVAATRLLPNNMVRSAGSTRSLQSVKRLRQGLVQRANQLDASLGKQYQHDPAAYLVEKKASGLFSFREASANNYAAVTSFITTCSNYLDTYGQGLVDAGVMAADFAQAFRDAGQAFNDAKAAMNDSRQSAKNGTGTVIGKVDEIKLELKAMQGFAKSTFSNEPELLRFFTEDYLLNAVRSKHPASLNGRITWPKEPDLEVAKPVAGLLVQVVGQSDKSAVTNKAGRYEIKQLAGGEHRVRITGEGIQPVELVVVLAPGVGRRQNLTVELAPVQVPAVMESKSAAPPATFMDEALNKAVQEVAVPANGVPASQNGYAVV